MKSEKALLLLISKDPVSGTKDEFEPMITASTCGESTAANTSAANREHNISIRFVIKTKRQNFLNLLVISLLFINCSSPYFFPASATGTTQPSLMPIYDIVTFNIVFIIGSPERQYLVSLTA
jgi:hypothetical protein